MGSRRARERGRVGKAYINIYFELIFSSRDRVKNTMYGVLYLGYL